MIRGHEFEPEPFRHVVIDDFFPLELAHQLEVDFPAFDDPDWYVYDNALEKKRTMNHWHRFPAATYRAMQALCEREIEGAVADYGLHGGGWHMMGNGGRLNPHEDYQIHPRLRKQRRWNLIVYLSSDFKEHYGGRLGFWKDGQLAKTIWPKFNRAVIFDTDGSVHGLATPVTCASNVYRKSIAVYYVQEGEGTREKALFYPRPGQGPEVEALIERRSRGEYI